MNVFFECLRPVTLLRVRKHAATGVAVYSLKELPPKFLVEGDPASRVLVATKEAFPNRGEEAKKQEWT
jgi:hypothetical protein